uniref:Uncharacterized protein n=1 Tax=Anopheles culicifacies TaxID=139723 RepID=A0A182MTU1_9DIPT
MTSVPGNVSRPTSTAITEQPRAPSENVERPTSTAVTEQPHSSLDTTDMAVMAPSLTDISRLTHGSSSAPVAATGPSVDTFTSNSSGHQVGVSAFTDGIYTEDGHINTAFSDMVMESSTGNMMTDMLGEETAEKLKQQYAKTVDKINDIELSAGQIAMAGSSLDYLDGEEPGPELRHVEEEEFPEDDIVEMPEMTIEPEASSVAADIHELDAEQLGEMATATGYLPQTEVSLHRYRTYVIFIGDRVL